VKTLKLYDYAASANCYKVRLLLAQLGLPYERIPVDIFAGDTLTEAFGALNPLRTTPVLDLGDGEVLTESGAILFYLAEGTRFLPEGSLARAEVIRWLLFEQVELTPFVAGLRFRLQTGRLEPGEREAVRRREGGEELLALLEEHLRDRDFFVGDAYSIADIAMFGYLHVAGEAGYELASYPALHVWSERVAALPRFIDDLAPYPANARQGAGRSAYD
jgi:glutathione S-transferase